MNIIKLSSHPFTSVVNRHTKHNKKHQYQLETYSTSTLTRRLYLNSCPVPCKNNYTLWIFYILCHIGHILAVLKQGFVWVKKSNGCEVEGKIMYGFKIYYKVGCKNLCDLDVFIPSSLVLYRKIIFPQLLSFYYISFVHVKIEMVINFSLKICPSTVRRFITHFQLNLGLD